MQSEIVMPQLGLTMTEGSVNAWLKQPGEHVKKGEMLFTVSTDKVEMEVESTGSVFLNPLVDLNTLVSVGTVIAVLTDQAGQTGITRQTSTNGQTSPFIQQPPRTAESKTATADSTETTGRGGIPTSPRARSLAKRLGVNLAEITPASGTRIVEADVQAHYDRSTSRSSEPVSIARRITAERTSQSFERAPHFYLGRLVNAGKLVRLREALQSPAERNLGFKITYTDFLLRALAIALREEPAVNAYWGDGGVVARSTIDVGFAAQTEKGLLVPVIFNAGLLGLFAIASQRKELSDKAREGKLQLQDLQGGSATLSNLGTYGIDYFQAILNPPQSVILASGAIAKRPVVMGDQVEAADTLNLSLSVDHRVLDGVAAAKFMAALARMIEDPLELLV